MRFLIISLSACFCVTQLAWADGSEQQVNELGEEVRRLRQVVEELNGTVKAQATRIAELEAGRSQTIAAAHPSAAPQAAALQQQTIGSLSAFNPEIGVLADIVAQSSESSAFVVSDTSQKFFRCA